MPGEALLVHICLPLPKHQLPNPESHFPTLGKEGMPTYGRASVAQHHPGRRQEREAARHEPVEEAAPGRCGLGHARLHCLPGCCHPHCCCWVPLAPGLASDTRGYRNGAGRGQGLGGSLSFSFWPCPWASIFSLPTGTRPPALPSHAEGTARLTEWGSLGQWTPGRPWCHLGGISLGGRRTGKRPTSCLPSPAWWPGPRTGSPGPLR